MYRIRYHGRGGQGMKTAGRILGTAFFLEGFEVQDAPRYGAERRGAPIFSFVRADHKPIQERGIITRPDLVIIADDTLVAIPAAGCLQGLDDNTVVFINTRQPAEVWQQRLNHRGPLLTFPLVVDVEDRAEMPFIGAGCTGIAARLLGLIQPRNLIASINEELADTSESVRERNRQTALAAFNAMADHEGLVKEAADMSAYQTELPRWIELPLDPADVSSPVIHGGLTSVEVNTGLWRTLRPVIDFDLCKKCWWVCSTYCPDSAILVTDDGNPEIDYDHCKGCMVCVSQCPPHAIVAVPEADALEDNQNA